MDEAKISVTGRLTSDPEIKYTPSGDAVVKLSVAVNERKFVRATNQWVDGETMYLRVEAWKQLGEKSAEQLRQGDTVTVLGDLKPDNWEKDGQKRIGFKVSAREISLSVRSRKHEPAAAVQESAW